MNFLNVRKNMIKHLVKAQTLSRGKEKMDTIQQLENRISELEACIQKMCNNALDLGYCDMRDCRECKTFKVCGVEE